MKCIVMNFIVHCKAIIKIVANLSCNMIVNKNGFVSILSPFDTFVMCKFCCRGVWTTDVSPYGAEEDDITGILNVFCKHLTHDRSGK